VGEEESVVVGGGSRPREDEDAGLVEEADAVAPLLDERGMVVWCSVVVGQAERQRGFVAEFDDEESGRGGGTGPGLPPGWLHASVVCAYMRVCVA